MKTSLFNISDHLKSEDDIRDFLQEVAETGDTSDFIHALGIAARAKGIKNKGGRPKLENPKEKEPKIPKLRLFAFTRFLSSFRGEIISVNGSESGQFFIGRVFSIKRNCNSL